MRKNMLKAFGKVLSVAVAAGVLAGAGSVTVQASETSSDLITFVDEERTHTEVYRWTYDEDNNRYNTLWYILLIGKDKENMVDYDNSNKTIKIDGGDNYASILIFEDGCTLYVNGDVTLPDHFVYEINENGEVVGSSILAVMGDLVIDMKPGTTLTAPRVESNTGKLHLADGVEMTYSDVDIVERNDYSYADYTNVVFTRKAFSPEAYFAAKFDEEMSNTASSVLNAADGAEVTVDGVASIPNYVMQSLVQKSTVSMTLNFTYEGEEYQVVIPAGSAMDNDIPWYGPLYLMGTYGYTKVADGTFVPACHPNGVGPDAQ